MTGKTQKILIYGYGNPGRQDDGLGVLLAEEIERWSAEKGFVNIHTDSNYQLNLEDADALAKHDLVIFADASREDIDTFTIGTPGSIGKVGIYHAFGFTGVCSALEQAGIQQGT